MVRLRSKARDRCAPTIVAAVLAGALVPALGCGGRNSDAGGAAVARGDEEVTRVGRVRIAGSTPFETVVLEIEAGDGLEVRGEYRPALRELARATVRATGTITEKRLFMISGYEILEIAGVTPVVGYIEATAGDTVLRTLSGEVVRLQGLTEAADVDGAQVWVILDGGGVVRAHGISREG